MATPINAARKHQPPKLTIQDYMRSIIAHGCAMGEERLKDKPDKLKMLAKAQAQMRKALEL